MKITRKKIIVLMMIVVLKMITLLKIIKKMTQQKTTIQTQRIMKIIKKSSEGEMTIWGIKYRRSWTGKKNMKFMLS